MVEQTVTVTDHVRAMSRCFFGTLLKHKFVIRESVLMLWFERSKVEISWILGRVEGSVGIYKILGSFDILVGIICQ